MYDHENHETENPSRNSGSFSSDGSYRFVRPESTEMLYRDAVVEPCEEEARMPRHYIPSQKDEHDEEPPAPAAVVVEAQAMGVTPDIMRHFWRRAVTMCTICALVGGLVGGGITALFIHKRTPAAAEIVQQSNEQEPETTPAPASHYILPTTGNAKSPAEIYAAACKQVVGITTEVTYHNMFGMSVSQPVSGTGFFISEDGYLLTNYHVVEYAVMYDQPAHIITHDGTRYDAVIVGYDPENDLAVLQVNANSLSYAPLGNSDGISVGDSIYAVGNPLGELQFSMTTGSVSATDRLISTQDSAPAINMFQIDAAVNSGNSGGPVYNTLGEVVGIVTAKYSEEGIEGLGFAIPINDAVSIATDLITTGYVTGKAKLGVDAQTMSARAAMYYSSVEGAYIRYIDPGSCAEACGLQLGDVIYRFGDFDVYTRDELQAAVRSYHAGDTVELSVYRNQKHLTILVTLDEDIPTDQEVSLPGTISHKSYTSPF